MKAKVQHLYLGACIIISGLLAIYFNYKQAFLYYAAFKILTTSLILLPSFSPSKSKNLFTNLIRTGLIFCLLGDALLLFKGYFVFGLIAFLIAHVLFAFAFIKYAGFHKPVIPGLALLSFGVVYYLFLLSYLGFLKIPVLVYISVILFMCWQGVTLKRANEKPFWTINLAVLLFILSDAVLAYNRFVEPFYLASLSILVTYWTSIYLLSISTRTISE